MSDRPKLPGKPRAYRRIDRVEFLGRATRKKRVDTAIKREMAELIRKDDMAKGVVHYFLLYNRNYGAHSLRNSDYRAQYVFLQQVHERFGQKILDGIPYEKRSAIQAHVIWLDSQLCLDIAHLPKDHKLINAFIDGVPGDIQRAAKLAGLPEESYREYLDSFRRLYGDGVRKDVNGEIYRSFHPNIARDLATLLGKIRKDVIAQAFRKLVGPRRYLQYTIGFDLLTKAATKELERREEFG